VNAMIDNLETIDVDLVDVPGAGGYATRVAGVDIITKPTLNSFRETAIRLIEEAAISPDVKLRFIGPDGSFKCEMRAASLAYGPPRETRIPRHRRVTP
jgi:hypothetical protein